jgi:hypothetical protein
MPDVGERLVVRLTDRADRPKPLRAREAFIVRSFEDVPAGFCCYIGFEPDARQVVSLCSGLPLALLPADLGYLQSGDIIRIHPSTNRVRVLYRRASGNNHFLVTERCNSLCLMCSQPPRENDGLLPIGAPQL